MEELVALVQKGTTVHKNWEEVQYCRFHVMKDITWILLAEISALIALQDINVVLVKLYQLIVDVATIAPFEQREIPFLIALLEVITTIFVRTTSLVAIFARQADIARTMV